MSYVPEIKKRKYEDIECFEAVFDEITMFSRFLSKFESSSRERFENEQELSTQRKSRLLASEKDLITKQNKLCDEQQNFNSKKADVFKLFENEISALKREYETHIEAKENDIALYKTEISELEEKVIEHNEFEKYKHEVDGRDQKVKQRLDEIENEYVLRKATLDQKQNENETKESELKNYEESLENNIKLKQKELDEDYTAKTTDYEQKLADMKIHYDNEQTAIKNTIEYEFQMKHELYLNDQQQIIDNLKEEYKMKTDKLYANLEREKEILHNQYENQKANLTEDILNREQELEKKNAKLLEKETAYQKKSEQLELDHIQLDLKEQDLAREIDSIKE
ncbi:spindle pole body component 110-like [Xenia sp. Carnegie-2017]|uniref:spindle pole body component 110-like n=1 Tax=Xenia sp. Carnegie-2017 TaxID=2897299 RepID=UPI001F0439BC|nr:spindle pole body component 110-like [Xenia sp. Carnegie-2017]